MSGCMFLREGATLRDGFVRLSSRHDREEGRHAPTRSQQVFKWLHMQAGAIGRP